MFKNIEISEINKKVVIESLFITWSFFVCALFLFGLHDGGIINGSLMILFLLVYGAWVWIPATVVITIIERLVVRNRSSENTVLILFCIELILPLLLILIGSASNNLKGGILLMGVLTIGQALRWFYLKKSGRMFNSAKRK